MFWVLNRVGKWREDIPKSEWEFTRDVHFIEGRGVYMEELEKEMRKNEIYPEWIGIPGKSIRARDPEAFKKTLTDIEKKLGSR